ncbi:hypothetical protein ZIOFF_059034 [Zingiber officinale]|uniref:Uncharacterized protein n=1 Tax=Zingiber officinale TaxID=94328 RepID=A0A8J5KMD5_ZINOF|nr:hypothetical protein ZIOFF_059034 [Zingiber officinale]
MRPSPTNSSPANPSLAKPSSQTTPPNSSLSRPHLRQAADPDAEVIDHNRLTHLFASFTPDVEAVTGCLFSGFSARFMRILYRSEVEWVFSNLQICDAIMACGLAEMFVSSDYWDLSLIKFPGLFHISYGSSFKQWSLTIPVRSLDSRDQYTKERLDSNGEILLKKRCFSASQAFFLQALFLQSEETLHFCNNSAFCKKVFAEKKAFHLCKLSFCCLKKRCISASFLSFFLQAFHF